MKQERPGLGRLGTRFFELVQMREQEVVSIGDLQAALEISARQEKKLLSHLSQQGVIVRLQKGVYLVPRTLPPGGMWSPSEYTLVAEYMTAIGARYQICGPAAFNYHGLSEQIPNRITVYNDKVSGLRKVGPLELQLVKVPIKRIGGWTTIQAAQSKQARIATLSRAIMDAVYDWSRFNSLPQAFVWIGGYAKDKKVMKELVECLIQFGNVSAQRRSGYVLEFFNVDPALVRRLYKGLKSTSSWIPLNPLAPAKGETSKKWRVIVNDKF